MVALQLADRLTTLEGGKEALRSSSFQATPHLGQVLALSVFSFLRRNRAGLGWPLPLRPL